MSVRIDIGCERCGKRVGTAKVSVPLQGSFNAFDSSLPTNERPLLVDGDDLQYWADRHTRELCDAEVERQHQKALAGS